MGKKRTATRFAQQVVTALEAKAAHDPNLLPFVTALSNIQKGSLGRSQNEAQSYDCLDLLPELLENATAEGPAFQEMLQSLVPQLTWRSAYDPAEVGEKVARGMVAGTVIGGNGLWRRDDVYAGLFLIEPGVYYPLHDHLSDELYFVVSGSIEVQNGFAGAPRTLQAGAYSITPSGTPHALTTRDEGALIVYAWIGEVVCEIFWWEQKGDDVWRRFKPRWITANRKASST